MKKVLLLLAGLFGFSFIYAQETFDEGLKNLAEQLAVRIDSFGNVSIAVWQFVDIGKQETKLGRYVGEDFSVHFTNAASNYKVMDRFHLEQLLTEHKLNSEGFIESETAKKLGKLEAVDYVVTGTIDVLNNKIKVRVKVMDTETAYQIAAEQASLPIDQNIASFLGVPGLAGGTNRGFNSSPVVGHEDYNNPETVTPKCESEQIGDYCFVNKTNQVIDIKVRRITSNGHSQLGRNLTVHPKQKSCLYDIESGVYYYELRTKNNTFTKFYTEGQLKVRTCKSVNHNINY